MWLSPPETAGPDGDCEPLTMKRGENVLTLLFLPTLYIMHTTFCSYVGIRWCLYQIYLDVGGHFAFIGALQVVKDVE